MGVYEIQVPRRPPPRTFPGGVSSSSSNSNTNSRQGGPRSHFKEVPPPPFSTAYQVSSPVSTSIDMEAPPPTYDEYLKIHNLHEETKDGPERY